MQNYWQGVLNQRLTRRRAIVATSATAGAAMLLAACGGSSDKPSGDANKLVARAVDTSKSAKKGGTLRMVQPADVPWLDPGMPSQPASLLQPYVYSQLLRIEPGYLKATETKPVPDIA